MIDFISVHTVAVYSGRPSSTACVRSRDGRYAVVRTFSKVVDGVRVSSATFDSIRERANEREGVSENTT